MNVLFFLDRFPGFGGIETVTSVLANVFSDSKINTSICSFSESNIELLDNVNHKVLRYVLSNDKNVVKEKMLFDIIVENKIEIVIYQHSYSNIFDILLKIKKRIAFKIISVEHNTPDAQIKMIKNYYEESYDKKSAKQIIKHEFLNFYLKYIYFKEKKRHLKLYNNSDSYVLLSKMYEKTLLNVTKLNNIRKVCSIANPISKISNKNILDSLKKEKLVIYVGRIDYSHKRVDRLLEIFNMICRDIDEWKLLIIGDGSEKNNLESYVSSNNIPNVEFLGFRKNVDDYYKRAKLLCLTSNIEGWPMVLLEAMNYGVIPIVYDSFDAANDIIEHGFNGFIVPSFNKTIYANTILKLVNDENLMKKISYNAKLSVEKYSVDKVSKDWIELFKNVSDERL